MAQFHFSHLSNSQLWDFNQRSRGRKLGKRCNVLQLFPNEIVFQQKVFLVDRCGIFWPKKLKFNISKHVTKFPRLSWTPRALLPIESHAVSRNRVEISTLARKMLLNFNFFEVLKVYFLKFWVVWVENLERKCSISWISWRFLNFILLVIFFWTRISSSSLSLSLTLALFLSPHTSCQISLSLHCSNTRTHTSTSRLTHIHTFLSQLHVHSQHTHTLLRTHFHTHVCTTTRTLSSRLDSPFSPCWETYDFPAAEI